ncbi:hypothetical protein AR158_C424L [Paramecium bursaria Chlorella virus AR158]|uniref:hypothetical protein n=1 Tax=Paramecium bursaria Chlorella virus AR158 TaxID=380598 RepID=UPI00015AA6CE|nr:hypothetical protein AR158_C424L [Paramecium bursaria Chlorella virus AR158]ABU43969.1 hypothetical protein AR158_C424L [Paramecium bursaria Chlorella virus AR158]
MIIRKLLRRDLLRRKLLLRKLLRRDLLRRKLLLRKLLRRDLLLRKLLLRKLLLRKLLLRNLLLAKHRECCHSAMIKTRSIIYVSRGEQNLRKCHVLVVLFGIRL